MPCVEILRCSGASRPLSEKVIIASESDYGKPATLWESDYGKPATLRESDYGKWKWLKVIMPSRPLSEKVIMASESD